MTAKDLINYMIPPLKPSEPVEKAIEWMRELHLNELPVVENGQFFGIFTESLLYDSDPEKPLISDFELLGSSLYLKGNEHYYELLKNAYDQGLNLVAVVDENEKYLGVVSILDVVSAFSKMSAINSPGSIITLSLPMIDYSMAEISRIIEAESGKILSSFVEANPEDNSKIRLTVKLNIENATNIISALERFGYLVVSKYGVSSDSDIEQERLDTLMKYLQI